MLIDIINAMQVLHRAVAGVRSAPELRSYPEKIEDGLCPIVLTWPTGGQWDEAAIGGGASRDREILVVSCFIAPVSLGYRGSLIVLGTQLLDALRPLYLSYVDITTIGGTVEQVEQVSHTGLRELTFAGTAFYGFQLTVPTILKENIL